MSFSLVSGNGSVCLERLFFSLKFVKQSMLKSSKPGSPESTKSGQFSFRTTVTEQTQEKQKPGRAVILFKYFLKLCSERMIESASCSFACK